MTGTNNACFDFQYCIGKNRSQKAHLMDLYGDHPLPGATGGGDESRFVEPANGFPPEEGAGWVEMRRENHPVLGSGPFGREEFFFHKFMQIY